MLILTIRSGLRSLRSVTPEQKEDILNAAAGRVRSLVEEHFDGLPSRRFWKEAADSVHVEPGKNGTVNINIYKRGVHLRYAGGTVKPSGQISELTGKPIKSLLIPGPRTAMRTQGLDLYDVVKDPRRVHTIKNHAGRVYLVEDAEQEGQKMRYLGRLVKQTTHKPDPTVMPSVQDMQEAAAAGANFVLKDLEV